MKVRNWVRLTPDVASKDGWLWAKNKMDYNSWQCEFTFVVNHQGHLCGDGFAFWYTEKRYVITYILLHLGSRALCHSGLTHAFLIPEPIPGSFSEELTNSKA
jgi:Legume-like lectin family